MNCYQCGSPISSYDAYYITEEVYNEKRQSHYHEHRINAKRVPYCEDCYNAKYYCEKPVKNHWEEK